MDNFLSGLPFLACVGFIVFRSAKPRRVLPDIQGNGLLTVGFTLFDAKNRKLIINGKTTDLTGTESRLLLIFALSPNETIE